MTTTIYLVDDHTVLRDGLQALLAAQAKFEVIGDADRAETLLAVADDSCPDIVLMDISLPDMNGIDATERFKRRCPESDVIILSMNADASYIHRALKAGASGYLLKDSAGVELVSAIESVAEGRRYLSQRITNLVIDAYIENGRCSRDRF